MQANPSIGVEPHVDGDGYQEDVESADDASAPAEDAEDAAQRQAELVARRTQLSSRRSQLSADRRALLQKWVGAKAAPVAVTADGTEEPEEE